MDSLIFMTARNERYNRILQLNEKLKKLEEDRRELQEEIDRLTKRAETSNAEGPRTENNVG